MAAKKIPYQEWMKVGLDDSASDDTEDKDRLLLESAVQKALKNLTPIERKLIERYYYRGESFVRIAGDLRKNPRHIRDLHRRAIKKLRVLLAGYVSRRFGLIVESPANCPICNCPDRRKINLLLKTKKKSETWKRIMKEIKTRYHLTITTPHILIGHQKYHLKEE